MAPHTEKKGGKLEEVEGQKTRPSHSRFESVRRRQCNGRYTCMAHRRCNQPANTSLSYRSVMPNLRVGRPPSRFTPSRELPIGPVNSSGTFRRTQPPTMHVPRPRKQVCFAPLQSLLPPLSGFCYHIEGIPACAAKTNTGRWRTIVRGVGKPGTPRGNVIATFGYGNTSKVRTGVVPHRAVRAQE